MSSQDRDAEVEFRKVLEGAGFILDAEPVMDGEWQRCAVTGDRGARQSGTYRGFLTGKRPAGSYRNFRDDKGAVTWIFGGEYEKPSAEQIARAEQEQKARVAAKHKEQEDKSAYATSTIKQMVPASADHPYLQRKQVGPNGLLADRYGNLVMPMRDVDGKIWSVQRIKPDGEKMFAKGARMVGTYYQIGVDDPQQKHILAEGFATGAKVHELTGLPVKVALNSGNLKAVAEALQATQDGRGFVIAGDNDVTREHEINPATGKPYGNPGKEGAIDAAQAVGGITALPEFPKDSLGTDWDDLAILHGEAEAKRQLEAALGINAPIRPMLNESPTVQATNEHKTSPLESRLLYDEGLGAQHYAALLESMDLELRAAAEHEDGVAEEQRAHAVVAAEQAMSRIYGYAAGSDRIATSLNDIPEVHQRAAMGLARTLAVTDGPSSKNPFNEPRLREAYEREHKFHAKAQARTAHEGADSALLEPSLQVAQSAARAQAFASANDAIAKRAAVETHPDLVNAFAMDAALRKFAAETLPPVQAERFMEAQRQMLISKLQDGQSIPTINVAQVQTERSNEHLEI